MSEHNQRRGTKEVRYPTFTSNSYGHVDVRRSNGFVAAKNWQYAPKCQSGSSDVGELSGKSVGAQSGWESSNGRRGMAKQVRGAKKFVRSRIRFHENMATRKLAQEPLD